ncbi:cytochrome d ubiquinol oxidase subunit II [Dictyobacter aurantiacus]|uniref:Cytochrome D ubiquinol oxidase subunit II n=1 Tax=Dictyobacter aurantiacus TaxID=1936993 RepID=A0A401ZHC2_9CHLR|nr:cytochrome d ubiquinol oxidase subunit II [Dictyobacter aurantiacus]GCE06236.1 cytochrome D ubiquinol oxidase subunit II [Dictyobacter aurantiacus]
MDVALIALVVLWWALIVYAALGGADFGAGVWDLFAVGKMARKQHGLINHALGPVWEANHVWLIFLIVGLFNVFPSAFYALSIALFFPFTIVLIGIVLRGAAFVYRYYALDETGFFARSWSRVFSVTSVITPFFLGVAAAGVASGRLIAPDGVPRATYLAGMLTPFAFVIGAMAVALCASVAAVYLVVEARDTEHDEALTESYRTKALITGAITAVLGALGLLLSISEAPVIWQGMLARAIPVVIATMLIGLGTAVALYRRYYRIARVLIIAETAFLLGSWGLSQYPYIIPTRYTIANSANDPTVITTLIIGIVCGLVILLPSLYYLFSVFKLPYPIPGLRRPEQARQTQARKNNEMIVNK